MKKVTIYSDGACSGNPGPGGFGTILQFGETAKEISRGFTHTTNNRMELRGVPMRSPSAFASAVFR
jgi:ribonuclease HI